MTRTQSSLSSAMATLCPLISVYGAYSGRPP
jgi:hypothetical protein